MSMFIDRKEQGNEIKIVFKKMAFYYYAKWFLLLTLLAVYFIDPLFIVPAGIGLIAYCVMAYIYLPASLEIKKAMKDNPVSMMGNKFSTSNPLTYTIQKSGN